MCLTSATFIFSPTPWHQRPLTSLNSLIFLTTATQMNKMTVQNWRFKFSHDLHFELRFVLHFTNLHNEAPKWYTSAFSSRDLLMKVPFVDPWSIATRIKSSSTCVIASNSVPCRKAKKTSRNTNRQTSSKTRKSALSDSVPSCQGAMLSRQGIVFNLDIHTTTCHISESVMSSLLKISKMSISIKHRWPLKH